MNVLDAIGDGITYLSREIGSSKFHIYFIEPGLILVIETLASLFYWKFT